MGVQELVGFCVGGQGPCEVRLDIVDAACTGGSLSSDGGGATVDANSPSICGWGFYDR